jgi:outer membrane protein assembly factor BamA
VRRGLVHIAVAATLCLLAGQVCVDGQSCASTPSNPSDNEPSLPEISIVAVTFSGALQLATSEQVKIAASITQQAYRDSLDGAVEEALERVRAGWQNRGYFRVQVSGAVSSVTSSPTSMHVSLSVHVNEGQQYSLGEISFKHNKVVPNAETLRTLFPITDGDIFSREKIAAGLENLLKAYGAMGYISFTAVPNTKLDGDSKLVHVEIDVDEGKQFYVSDVEILGLEPAARQELLKDLPIKPGQIYSSRLWELWLLKYGSMFPDCKCRDHEPLLWNERASTVALILDFRPCSCE